MDKTRSRYIKNSPYEIWNRKMEKNLKNWMLTKQNNILNELANIEIIRIIIISRVYGFTCIFK
jgi:hypothetical protein